MFALRWPVTALLLLAPLFPPLVISQVTGGGRKSQRGSSGAALQELDRKLHSALAHFNSKEYAAARQELEPLAKDFPESFEAQELLGMVYSAEGHEEKATAPLERAVRLRPNSGPARNNLAANLARLGKNSLAEAEFKKVLELEPGSFDANRNLASFYLQTGKIPTAIPYLEKARSENPASYENGYDLALAYEEEGRLPEARRQIQELLRLKDTAELHNLLAGIEERSGNYVAAVNEYEKAAHMDPSESNIFDWGRELLAHQTPVPATEVFSEGLKRYPDSPRLAIGLGLALDLRGSYDDAVKALLHGVDLSPSDPRAYYFLSKAYERAPSQADAVVERFRRYAELRSRDAQAALYYALSLWKGRRSETAEAYLDQVESLLKNAIALNPSSAEAHLQLANLYSQRRQFAEAVPEYQQALKLSPHIADAHFRLGQAYVHLGKKDWAEKEFQLHKQYYEQHLAEVDKQRSEIQQFVYSTQGAGGTSNPVDSTPSAKASSGNAQDSTPLEPSYHDDAQLKAGAVQGTIDAAGYSSQAQSPRRLLTEGPGLESGEFPEERKLAPAEMEQELQRAELAAKQDPSEKNLLNWGNDLLLSERVEPALEVFQRGVALYPGSSRMYIGLGIARYSRGSYDAAMEALCHASDLDPADPRAYLYLGKMLSVAGSHADDVAKRLKRFMETYPGNPIAYYYRALSIEKRTQSGGRDGNAAEVEALLKKSLALEPRLAEAHLQLGILYSSQQRDREAVQEFVAAIRLKPEDADAHYRLAQLYLRAGDQKRGNEELQLYEKFRK